MQAWLCCRIQGNNEKLPSLCRNLPLSKTAIPKTPLQTAVPWGRKAKMVLRGEPGSLLQLLPCLEVCRAPAASLSPCPLPGLIVAASALSPSDFKPTQLGFFARWHSSETLLQKEDQGKMSLLNSASPQGLMQPVFVIARPSNWQSCHRHWLLPPASRETCEKSLCHCWEIVFEKGISS